MVNGVCQVKTNISENILNVSLSLVVKVQANSFCVFLTISFIRCKTYAMVPKVFGSSYFYG